MVQKLETYGLIDESHGILTVWQIKDCCSEVFQKANVEFCYLFGSYAKGKATEKSGVDLLISTPVSGIKFYDFAEALREGIKKRGRCF